MTQEEEYLAITYFHEGGAKKIEGLPELKEESRFVVVVAKFEALSWVLGWEFGWPDAGQEA